MSILIMIYPVLILILFQPVTKLLYFCIYIYFYSTYHISLHSRTSFHLYERPRYALCMLHTHTWYVPSLGPPILASSHIEVKTKSFQSSKNHSNHFDTDDVDNNRSSFLLQRDARSIVYFIFHISFIWYTYLLLYFIPLL